MEIRHLDYKLSPSDEKILNDKQKSENNNVLIDRKIWNFSTSYSDSDSLPISEKNIIKIVHEDIPQITRRFQRTILDNVSPYLQITTSAEFENKRETYTGKKTGQVRITWSNGDKYKGDAVEYTRTGIGTFTSFDDGNKYVGRFVEGIFQGKGTYILPNGDEYEGDFHEGNLIQGTYIQKEGGEKYVGEFKDSKFNGKGTYIWPSGAKYVGEFLNNKESGNGTFFEPNGNVYEGFFLNGIFTEETISLPDKGKFVGNFVNGTGQGTFFRADGGIYKGDFLSLKFHGKGEFTWPDGKNYVGDYVEGKRTGYGILKWPNGDKYKGQFFNDKPLMGRSHKNS